MDDEVLKHSNLIAYFAAAIVFLGSDAVWLGVVAKDLYRAQIGHLLAQDFRIGPAAVFYLMYVAGIVYFAIAPALATLLEQSERKYGRNP